MADGTIEQLRTRIHTIEEAYEFLLAYAARGLRTDRTSQVGSELRDYLQRSVDASRDLAGLVRQIVQEQQYESAERYEAFADLLDEDGRKARTVLELILAQPDISSQLVDNLNASIHVRRLLTDLFVIDEIVGRSLTAVGAANEATNERDT